MDTPSYSSSSSPSRTGGEPSPESSNPPSGKGKRRGCSCMTVFMLLALVAMIAGPVLLYTTDLGSRVKRGILEIIEATREPAEAEPQVVEKIVKVEVPVEKIVEKIVEVKVPVEMEPEPLPEEFMGEPTEDTAKILNGMQIRSVVKAEEGGSATASREEPRSYEIELSVNLTIPKASETLEELSELNGHLPKALPGLPRLLEAGEVSDFYHHLYQVKKERVQSYVTRIDQYITRLDYLLSRHNFYDCETILEMTHPETDQRVLLLQGDMDVVSDGSDGDRLASLDQYISMSKNYQPFTSYGWAKKTKTPNPLLPRWEADLKKYEEEFAIPGLSIERNQYLRSRIDELKREIADIKARSYLIAETDPFVVVPLSLLGRTKENPFGPSIGDYAVVIHDDQVLPAIVGDAGPSFKMGEASLRIAKEINENANPYSRPESELKVTYLVFPGSAEEKKDAPDLTRWHQRCQELLERIGGLGEGYTLHEWKDLIAEKKAPPAPEPEPAADPQAAPNATPDTAEPASPPAAETGAGNGTDAAPAADDGPQPE